MPQKQTANNRVNYSVDRRTTFNKHLPPNQAASVRRQVGASPLKRTLTPNKRDVTPSKGDGGATAEHPTFSGVYVSMLNEHERAPSPSVWRGRGSSGRRPSTPTGSTQGSARRELPLQYGRSFGASWSEDGGSFSTRGRSTASPLARSSPRSSRDTTPAGRIGLDSPGRFRGSTWQSPRRRRDSSASRGAGAAHDSGNKTQTFSNASHNVTF